MRQQAWIEDVEKRVAGRDVEIAKQNAILVAQRVFKTTSNCKKFNLKENCFHMKILKHMIFISKQFSFSFNKLIFPTCTIYKI